MTEISRIESIEVITKWIGCKQCEPNECRANASACEECKYSTNGYEITKSLEIALSDMEKLEKIEEVITSMEYTDDEIIESFAFRQIEQITKG